MKITKSTSKEDMLDLGNNECKSNNERCGHCCKFGSGYVLQEDIKRIADFLGIPEELFKEKCLDEVTMFNTKVHKAKTEKKKKGIVSKKEMPYGQCIFFNDKAGCIIHEVKPFHCRISNCDKNGEAIQAWFIANHLVNPDDPESIRQFKNYMKSNGKMIEGATIFDLVPDKKKLKDILSYKII